MIKCIMLARQNEFVRRTEYGWVFCREGANMALTSYFENG